MKTLVLSSHDLRIIYKAPSLNAAMRSALINLSGGGAVNFNRHIVGLTSNAALGFMPATFLEGKLLGYKTVSVFAENKKHRLNPHQGFVVLLDSENGSVKSILEGSTVTALRTAAVSAVATEKLSRTDSSTLALVGAGRQALEHALAIVKIRPIKKINIFNRTKSRAENLAQTYFKDFQILIAPTPHAAIVDADIVVTCTNSNDPLISTTDLRPGAHVNAVGACRPGYREIEFTSRSELKIYLDSTEACMNEASELIMPLASGELSSDAVRGELGACLQGKILGRVHTNDITVFKSVGLGIQDLFAADYFYQQAQNNGLGTLFEFGGPHE